jgi:multiple antibiotic resistance protein
LKASGLFGRSPAFFIVFLESTNDQQGSRMPELPVSKLFVLLFMMMGPLRVAPGFAGLTRELDEPTRNRLANRSVCFAAARVGLAVVVGHTILRSWGATPESLAAATGLLLLLTALQAVIGWPVGNTPSAVSPAMDSTSPAAFDAWAIAPVAFPILLPPFAVGVLILFGAYFPDWTSKIAMLLLAVGLLAVDWLAMRFARQIMAVIGASTLQVLGAVFGVLQLALAVQMMLWALRTAFGAEV